MNRKNTLFIETPLGIVTRRGDWFHTTADHIEGFVPGLLQERSLENLVEEANAWVLSADSLAMSLLLVLLFFIHPVLAAVITIAFHFFWYRTKSAFVTIFLGKVLKFLNSDGYLLIISFFIISVLGMGGQYLAATVALIFFLLLKPGLLKRLWDYIDKGSNKKLSLNDRVFKMVLIKYAMYYNKKSSEVEQMEDRFLELASSRKDKSRK